MNKDMQLWYPYKQMKHAEVMPVVRSGSGVMLQLEDGRSLIDGISSWWSVIHGYNHPELNAALIDQVNRFSHVMLGGLSHSPASAFAAELCRLSPEGLNHVFFSDSGSIGVEVALKMALQYWQNEGYAGKTQIISLRNGYHGDTFKAMEVSDDSDFTHAFADVLHRGYIVDVPEGGYDAGEASVAIATRQLELLLQEHSSHIACFILEPILQGAGGMRLYSPLYLKAARQLCHHYNVLLVFDEVATGFGRTGKLFAAEHAGVSPDIMIVGKAMAAGYLGHAATLASTKVFNSFLGDSYDKALMHGPTFMGNPLACAVALKSVEIFKRDSYLEKIGRIEAIIKAGFATIESSAIKEKRVLGAMGAIEMNDETTLVGFKQFAMYYGVWLRPIGRVLYLMPPYIISEVQLRKVIEVMREWIGKIA